TLTDVAPATTWLLVRTSPVEVSTIPVPSAVALAKPCVEMTSTRPGAVRLVIAAVLSAPAAPPVAEPTVAQAAPPATSAAAVTPDARISTRRRERRGGAACWPPGAP